jgi:FdhD protein
MPAMASSDRSSRRVPTIRLRDGAREMRWDVVAGEEPLQIRASGPGQAPEDVAVTMRTPGHEEELALGFLIAEGLLPAGEAAAVEFEYGDPALVAQPENELHARLPVPLDLGAVAERHFHATASCGICGRASTDELVARVPRLGAGPTVDASTLMAMPARLRQEQAIFDTTGGLHAAGLFSVDGELLELREDIGRHNAVDKLVGSRALAGALPARASVMIVSGRVSFEIVQKVAVAGVPILGAVSAPSDLAVATAERVGMTLVGFLREGRFNVYEAGERIDLDA